MVERTSNLLFMFPFLGMPVMAAIYVRMMESFFFGWGRRNTNVAQ
jgi:hypothetical protein